MDNYFTVVKTMIGTRKCGVAVMDTARARYVLDNIYIYIYVCVCVCVCVCAYVYMCVYPCN